MLSLSKHEPVEGEDIMETVGLGQYWNDLELGQTFKTVGRTITEVDIITFINCTGMVEVMFTDIEYIMSKSAIKGRVAPAALVYAMSEGLLIQATGRESWRERGGQYV